MKSFCTELLTVKLAMLLLRRSTTKFWL